MEKEFSYYVIEPEITERTPLLMNDPSVDPDGIDFLSTNEKIDDNYIAHLQFLMPLKNPDMDVDYLFLETDAVFSKEIHSELQKHMPIQSLQLVKAIINEEGEEYNNFWITNVYKKMKSFDEKQSVFESINRRGIWFDIDKIVLNQELLSEIPLEERLVFKSLEDPAFKLYHESVVEIINSINPKGMKFIPIEEWRP